MLTPESVTKLVKAVSEAIESQSIRDMIVLHRMSVVLRGVLYWELEDGSGMFVAFNTKNNTVHLVSGWTDELYSSNQLNPGNIAENFLIELASKQLVDHLYTQMRIQKLSATLLLLAMLR